jgi:integrase/recombinase XerD
MSQAVVQVPASEQLLVLFVEDCHIRGLTAETIRRYKSVTEYFLRFIEQRNVRAVNVDKHVLQDFIRVRRSDGIDQKTLENELSAVSSFFGFLAFEDYMSKNPVPEVRKRYLNPYKKEGREDIESPRKLISVAEMAMLINSILDSRDRAVVTLLAKCGLRRGELISLNITDIDWAGQSITLQRNRFKKRSNRRVFFDDETGRVLRRWLAQREVVHPVSPALFVGEKGNRLERHGVYQIVVKAAERVGLHDSKSSNTEDHFSPHNCRHWFSTHLLNAGMNRTYVQILRGDARRDPIDVYHHVDLNDVRKEYLAFVPQFLYLLHSSGSVSSYS